MSIKTLGENRLPRRDKKAPSNRLVVIFGNPEGDVRIFHDFASVPAELLTIIGDYRYTKIQSDIYQDIDAIWTEGVRLKGFLDTNLIHCAFIDPMSKENDHNEQALYLAETHNFIPQDEAFGEALNSGEEPKKDYKAWLAQQVRQPFLILLSAVLNEAIRREMYKTMQVFPMIQEVIEICRSKDPMDLKLYDGHILISDFDTLPMMNWRSRPVPHRDEELTLHKYGLPNCYQRTITRRSLGDFVEPMPDGLGWTAKARVAKEIYGTPPAGTKRKPQRLPRSGEMSDEKFKDLAKGKCVNCGIYGHKWKDCLAKKVPCKYEHGRGKIARELGANHSILMCPIMQMKCSMCNVRGHEPSIHASQWKSQQQLRELFLRYFHEGYYTCIPTLFHYAGEVNKADHLYHYHWILGHNAQRQHANWADVYQYGHESLVMIHSRNEKPEKREENEQARRFAITQAQANVDEPDHTKFIPVQNYTLPEYTRLVEDKTREITEESKRDELELGIAAKTTQKHLERERKRGHFFTDRQNQGDARVVIFKDPDVEKKVAAELKERKRIEQSGPRTTKRKRKSRSKRKDDTTTTSDEDYDAFESARDDEDD